MPRLSKRIAATAMLLAVFGAAQVAAQVAAQTTEQTAAQTAVQTAAQDNTPMNEAIDEPANGVTVEPTIEETGTLKENGVRHVSVDEAHALIAAYPDIVVLDVRTRSEVRRGHIEGAKNINYFSRKFGKRIKELDPEKTYLVHCKSGHRSGRAAPLMRKAGITTILHMDGGFDAWKKAGHPRVREAE